LRPGSGGPRSSCSRRDCDAEAARKARRRTPRSRAPRREARRLRVRRARPGPETHALADARGAADDLVAHRLARFVDAPRTTIELTPFGRYWSTEGGYLAFLKSDGAAVGPARGGGGGGADDAGMDPATRNEYQRLRMDLITGRR
jgi:hypothetical protein